jgi:hypothetical protein
MIQRFASSEKKRLMRANRRAGDEDFVITSHHTWRNSIATQLLDADAPAH